MKKLIFSMAFVSLLLIKLNCFGQDIPPAPENKAVVYFVRPTSFGFAINFTYFDSTRVIGRFNGPKYIRYECEPGQHLFWARSENRDFMEANVEAGKIYFIEALVKTGALKAAVRLEQRDPNDPKQMARILKLMTKKPSESFTKVELEKEFNASVDVINRGLTAYTAEKAKGKKEPQLDPTKFYKKP